MARDPGALEAALHAALVDDPDLIGEVRGAFMASARGHLARLRAAVDDRTITDAAKRLQGLAASFGADEIRVAALSVQHASPDQIPAAIARIDQLIARLT